MRGAEPGAGYLIVTPNIVILTTLKNPSNIFPHREIIGN
jgi:hypothetical protein